jgi:prepilin-type N-terminal cleavage/methylation domain-containing protein
MKRAFTLIELLVVIAIIAILAAILFPVFAQAKEAAKKTSALSNAKQVGTSIQIYLADSDDMFPRATLYYNNSWYAGTVFPFPTNSIAAGVYSTDAMRMAASETYPNSVQPYTKSVDIFQQGSKQIEIPGYTYTSGANGKSALTFNGFMQNLSSSVVQAPSSAVLVWGGLGDSFYKNFASANPQLGCSGANPNCTFSSSASGALASSGGMYRPAPSWTGATSYTPWTYAKGVSVIRADTSAKWRKIANQVNKDGNGPYNEDVWNDPYAAVYKDSGGMYAGQSFGCNKGDGDGWDPAAPASVLSFTCFFRPDRAQ